MRDRVRELWSRLRGWASGHRGIAEDLAEEIQSHLDMQAEPYVGSGMDPQDARLAARRHFGNATAVAPRHAARIRRAPW